MDTIDGAVINGLVLMPGRANPAPGTVTWRNGVIDEVLIDDPRETEGPDSGRDGHRTGPVPPLDLGDRHVIDADGALVLPGIIDMHGDAFERCLMPRSGVPIDVDIALTDNDAQLLSAGITTSYLSATDSWEPGLRSRATLRQLIDGLRRRRGGPEVLLHVRHERCNTKDIAELEGWISEGTVHLLSFNDHTLGPPGGSHYTPEADGLAPVGGTQVQRCGVDAATLRQLQAEAAGDRNLGMQQEEQLADAAARVGCRTASHDASTVDHHRRDRDLGVSIAEFPTSIELAKRYRADAVPVLLGAPNLVRGGSHTGNLSVGDALAAGVGDLLCSDYHYPSLLQAPFVAARSGLRTFGQAWDLVSATPAEALGLPDRGRLAPGARADIVIIDPGGADGPARVEHALVGGRHSYTLA